MKSILRILKWSFFTLTALFLSAVLSVAFINGWVLWRGERYIVKPHATLPPGSVGVVLGTSPRTGRGQALNPFFEGRMNTAAALYHSGALYHLVVSGDNRRADYNEPFAMRDALLQRGVPPTALTLDYAGFRTLDSVARARRVFEIEHPVIITDDFHIARALFLAEAEGIEALGIPSVPLPWRRSYKTRIREWGSRVLAWMDVYLLKTQPHFLGKAIQLPKPLSSDAPESPDSSKLPKPDGNPDELPGAPGR